MCDIVSVTESILRVDTTLSSEMRLYNIGYLIHGIRCGHDSPTGLSDILMQKTTNTSYIVHFNSHLCLDIYFARFNLVNIVLFQLPEQK